MRRMVEKILRYYGQDLAVIRAGERFPARGFLQGITGTAESFAQVEPGVLGLSGGRYVYIGPLEPQVCRDDELEYGGKRYLVRRSEQIGGAYTWAMCVEKGGEDTWGWNG